MFAGAQVSLYPMADGFVDVILSSLSALDPWRDKLRIETDDISTLIVGPPEVLFPALRDLYSKAAATNTHVVLRATLSRGCPGEPDDPICQTGALANPEEPIASRQKANTSEAPLHRACRSARARSFRGRRGFRGAKSRVRRAP